jgi:hypothetical protein
MPEPDPEIKIAHRIGIERVGWRNFGVAAPMVCANKQWP